MINRNATLENIQEEINAKRLALDQIHNARMAVRAATALPSPIFQAATGVPAGHRTFNLLAQGDSWFDYPVGKDIIDCLHDNHGHTIVNLAVAGSTLNDEAYGPVPRELFGLPFGFPQSDDPSRIAELVHRIQEDKPDALLISAGGNDVAGDEFFSFINNARSGRMPVNEAVLDGVIRDTFEPAYEFMMRNALDAARAVGIKMPIFLHGYDYPFPDGRGVISFLGFKVGPWFDGPFNHKNYSNLTPRDLQRRHDILAKFIDAMNDMQRRLVQKNFGEVFHVDLRGTILHRDDWANELHPRNPGFAQFAQKIDASLQQNISLAVKPASTLGIAARRKAAPTGQVGSLLEEQLNATGSAQVLVVLRQASAAVRAVAAGASTISASSAESNVIVQRLQSHFTDGAAGSDASLAVNGGPHRVLHFPNLGVMLGRVTYEGLCALRADEAVTSVDATLHPTLIRPVKVATAAAGIQIDWGIDFLQIRQLWDQGLTGKGVRVGHLDTGADGKHPALKGAIHAFAEFDMFGNRVMPDPMPHDSAAHGTHTAATIAGRRLQKATVGVAPGCELASAIVIEGGDLLSRILGGMDWAIDQNVRILNMSLGLRGVVNSFLALTQILRSRNILPIFAVGNEGPNTSRSPGNYPEALSVGAVDRNGKVATFSSSERFVRTDDPLVPDVVAPGVDVVSARPGGGFQLMSGSSMATPHIAGLAALLFEAKLNATVTDVENAIFSSCVLNGIPPTRGNRGIPNAVRALTTLTGIPLNPIAASKRNAKGSRSKTSRKNKQNKY